MFATPAYAQTAGGTGPASQSFLVSMLPLVAIFIIFYVLLIMPQQRRAKRHQQMIAAVKKNDTAITAGGLVGKVTRVEDNEVELEIAPNVRVRVIKGTLSEVRPFGTKPAND